MRARPGHWILLAIVLLGLSLRVRHFTAPYLDHHSWRQTLTAMIARNFYEHHSFNIFKPEVDLNGDGPSIIELELQVTTILTSLLYYIFGVHDWVGRVIPIAFWILSAIYLYRLIKLHTREGPALFAAFAYAVLPLSVFFTRVLMPEAVMLFLSLASLYYFSMYTKEETDRRYALSLVFTALAFISKPAAPFLLIPLVFIAYRGYGLKLLLNRRIQLFFLISTAVTILYYAHMHYRADIRMFSYKVGTDKWGNIAIWTSAAFYRTLFQRFCTVLFTIPGLVLFVIGLFLNRGRGLFYAWLISVVIYFFTMAKGNQTHTYYQVPLVPVGCYFIGLALSGIYEMKHMKIAAFLLCGLLLYSSVTNIAPWYGEYADPCYKAAMKLREIDPQNSLVLYVPHRMDLEPEFLYYAHRKGWVERPRAMSMEKIMEYERKGARYLVMTNPSYLSTQFIQQYAGERTVARDKNYIIIRL